jgi:hypothetical protein
LKKSITLPRRFMMAHEPLTAAMEAEQTKAEGDDADDEGA